MDQSLFTRFVRLGIPYIGLNAQGRARPSIARLYIWRYRDLGGLPYVKEEAIFHSAIAGFCYEYQLVNVPEYRARGQTAPCPRFYLSVGEAEYIVSVYMFMRLLGYPANKISILTTYNGQKLLIRDVIASDVFHLTSLVHQAKLPQLTSSKVSRMTLFYCLLSWTHPLCRDIEEMENIVNYKIYQAQMMSHQFSAYSRQVGDSEQDGLQNLASSHTFMDSGIPALENSAHKDMPSEDKSAEITQMETIANQNGDIPLTSHSNGEADMEVATNDKNAMELESSSNEESKIEE
ncbi:RNA helicase aquarius [Camellia lanceoleosa]|uniref:RNA helicase aquarius n=1 Tax=Camellia lanceoleosa TaxID=1840588 RepID=A0ACC0IFR2_9ERIC|nr:RNA helicase aquarius [Camellia lanceoleosa]